MVELAYTLVLEANAERIESSSLSRRSKQWSRNDSFNMFFTLALLLTIAAGFIEAQGYVLSFDAIREGSLIGLMQSYVVYSVGIVVDYGALYILRHSSMYVPELLSMIFMGSAIIGIALFSGQFFGWDIINKCLAVTTALCLCALAYRIE